MKEAFSTDSNFYDAAELRFGREAADFAQTYLARFGLPLPDKGQFYDTNIHSGKLAKLIVFLEPQGLAIRFYEPFAVPVTDFILQPLVKTETPLMHIDIVPLVPVGILLRDLEGLIEGLWQQGIRWGDEGTHNAAYIAEGHATIIDLCDTLISSRENSAPVQDRIFREWKQASLGVTSVDGLPAASGAKAFFSRARQLKSAHGSGGMLSEQFRRSGIARTGGQCVKAVQAAENYAARLSASRPEIP